MTKTASVQKKYWWQRERTLIFMRILSPHTWRLPRCPLLNPIHHQLIFYHWANIKWPFFLQKIESFHGLQLIFWRQLDMDIVVCKTHFLWTNNRVSTPPAKKTEPSNLVLRAQDHKKNPKFKGWQWDLKNPKFKIRSSKERRTKSEITEIVVEKYVFKIPKIQNFRNTRNQ